MKKMSQTEQNDLITLLSKALSDEWKAHLQYVIHASRMRGLAKDSIAEHLDEHADDEKNHAERLTKHFYSHGLPIDINIENFNPGNDIIEMINMDLEDEVKAIDLYTQIVRLCEDIPELTDTRMLIEDILVDEVDHGDDNASFIKAQIDERAENFNNIERVAIASTFIQAADAVDELGLKAFADKYTKFAKEI